MSGLRVSESSYSHVIEVRIETVDIGHWVFTRRETPLYAESISRNARFGAEALRTTLPAPGRDRSFGERACGTDRRRPFTTADSHRRGMDLRRSLPDAVGTDPAAKGPSNFAASRELFDLSGLPKLDRIDVNILVQLQKDGRMTNANLADAVGLSASPCLQRVKRLEAAGYITGYGANVNLGKLTESITVFTEVTLIDHRKEDFVRFESNLRNVEELMECHLVSGGYDYLLRFVSRSISHYQELIENLLERNIGIEKYFSYIVLKSPIVKNVLPLKALIDPPR